MFEGLPGRHGVGVGAGLLCVALAGCSAGITQPVAKTTLTPTPVLSSSSATYTPEPSTPAAPPTTVAPLKVDCTGPTVTITKVVSNSEKVPDVARDMVFNSISPSTVAMTYTNHSANPIVVSYLTMRFVWRNVPNADQAKDMVSPMDTNVNVGPLEDPSADARVQPGASGRKTFVFPADANILTPSTALTVTATAHWAFVSPAVEATCHLVPQQTMRVGASKDGAPFSIVATRSRAGAVLADVKSCANATDGGDAVLDASTLWAVTTTGAKVKAAGAENTQAKTAGAGRLKVPVANGSCRTTTVAFLTGEKVTYIAAPGEQNVPWRWMR